MKSGMYLERAVNRQPNTAAIVISIGNNGELHVMKKGRAEVLTEYDASIARSPKLTTKEKPGV